MEQAKPPFSPPPGLAPQFIMTPDAAPLTPSPASNTLNRWLIVNGSLMLGLTVIQLVMLKLCKAGDETTRSDISLILALFTTTVSLFVFGWVIYAGVLIFNHSGKTCKNSDNRKGHTIWLTTLAMWILDLASLPALIYIVVYTAMHEGF